MVFPMKRIHTFPFYQIRATTGRLFGWNLWIIMNLSVACRVPFTRCKFFNANFAEATYCRNNVRACKRRGDGKSITTRHNEHWAYMSRTLLDAHMRAKRSRTMEYVPVVGRHIFSTKIQSEYAPAAQQSSQVAPWNPYIRPRWSTSISRRLSRFHWHSIRFMFTLVLCGFEWMQKIFIRHVHKRW